MLRLSTAAVLVLLTGCAGGQPGSSGSAGIEGPQPPNPNEMTLHVVNEFDAPVTLTPVWDPDMGQRRLPVVRGSREEDLQIPWNPGIMAVIVQSSAERRRVISNQIFLDESDRGGRVTITIGWDFRAILEKKAP